MSKTRKKLGTMTAALKKKWVTALRSGKFTQGTSWLKNIQNDGEITHCCLGVLAEIAGVREFAPGEINETVCFGRRGGCDDYSYDAKLPVSTAKRLGLSSDLQDKLSCMNDQGQSFKRIATWISKNL